MNDDLLDRLRALAGTRAPGVWVVGGAVRDVLAGHEPHEADLLVETGELEHGEPVARHERFGTASVRHGGTVHDVARPRRETYAHPGALPDVEFGASVDEDLTRRDFTVNAMAVRLRDGALAAVPGAREDLAAGVLRVLHPQSFRDDPTRLLRLVRYAARLGFEPDGETARLAQEAIRGGALDTVTGPRLGAELRLLVREPQPAGLRALARFGLGRALLGEGFDPGPVESALALVGPGMDAGVVALGAVSPGPEHLEHLAVPLRERPPTGVGALVGRLRAAGTEPVALHRAVAGAPPEAVAIAGALGPAEAARAWLEDVRHVRTAVTGDELVAAGLVGPAVGVALRVAQQAALEGRDRAAQLAAALSATRP